MRGAGYRITATGALLCLLLLAAPVTGRAGNAGVQVSKTVDSTSIAPALALTLAVDRSSAIPGDALTYSGQVTNTGSTFGVGGRFTAASHDDATSTVASYFDEIELCVQGCGDGLGNPQWVPFVGFSAVRPGYTPVDTPVTSTGLTLTAVPVPAVGVTYSTGGDTILGTAIGPGAVGTWTYQASMSLTPDQVARLSSFNPTEATRNRIHFEVVNRNTNAAEPWSDVVEFPNPFQAVGDPAAVRNVTVTVTPPSGPALTVTSSTVPGLALLRPGTSAAYSARYTVPAPAARAAGESDATYLGRLTALEGSALTAAAAASGTAVTGGATITAPAPPAVTTAEHLPILGIAKSGPAQVDAGGTEVNPLALQNSGGATATGLAVTDTAPGGAAGAVTGVPASLAAGATAGAEADFAVAAGQPAGSLTDTASVTWHDANGNAYGPVSSSFTTTVVNSLAGAHLTLAPSAAGPNPTGTSQRLTATLVDAHGAAIPNQPVTFAITGANPGTSGATTDSNGAAVLTYTGANRGTDVVQATVTSGSQVLQSNTSTVDWITPPATVSTTPAQGNFFAEPASATSFVARPGDTPAFGQTFPNIGFDPPAGIVNHNVSGVGPGTRPFTDVTTDTSGNFVGTIVAQGNGVQAGVGALSSFDAVFTASFVVARPGDVTFNVIADDGFLLGVGGGATRVSGTYENPPASNTSPFSGFPLVGAFNRQGGAAPQTFPVTVHFPAAGTYPYELDYFECCGTQLSLVLTVATFTADSSPLSVYVGYADGLRPGGSIFPFPWQGSSGVTHFVGGGSSFDAGALRFDNSSDEPIVLDRVTVDIGSTHFDIWGSPVVVDPHSITILTQTFSFNFDTSDVPITCTPTGVIPKVHVTQNGVTTTFSDSQQVLNTRGVDPPSCGGGNESHAWERIGGGGSTINVPLPPATTLVLSPTTVPGDVVGTAQPITVAALDGSGEPVPGLPVTVVVFGANARQLQGTTGLNGTVTLGYTGTNAGTDNVQATAFVSGLRTVSNSLTVTWSIPVPGGPPSGGTPEQAPPAISAPSPAAGTVVSAPLPVSAAFTPPDGETIASWSVSYQATGGVPVTLASGTGAPPSPLATFDPTLLVNDTYAITITATASGGGTQALTTTVSVTGSFKPGRYVTTYQDASVPVNGLKMTVQRTYDSSDKRVGDFGVGWHVDLSNVRVATNGPLGAGSWSIYPVSCTLFCSYGFASSSPHFVTVTYPDGHQEVFDFTPAGGFGPFYFLGSAAFTARPGTGTTSKLEALDNEVTYGFDGTLRGGLAGPVYSPRGFRLTTRDGKVLLLDTGLGLVSETDRNGNSLTVDGAGVHASNGQSITFTRDSLGRITDIGGPVALHYDYSAAGDLAGYVDARGSVFTYSYDGNHDLLSSASGDQPLTSFRYDAAGRLVAITDANGNTTTIANDVGAHQQTVTDALGLRTIVSTQDDLGHLIREDVVAGGRTSTVRATYDSAGRPTSYTDAAGSTTTMTYDSAGNLTIITDPAGHRTTYTYDAFGDMLTVTDPTGAVVQTNTYDANGNLTRLQRADGTGPSFVYDAAGRVTRLVDPLGGSASYGFDSSGHLASATDPLGRRVTYTADALGHVTSVTSPAGTTTYSYDGAGNATAVRDPRGGTWRLEYDALGRLTARTDPLGATTRYRYDAAGNLVEQTNRLGQTTDYAYDADGRLVRAGSSTGDTTTYGYDAAGHVVNARNETADLRFAYDDANRVVSETSTPVDGSSLPTVTFANEYDGAGNRARRTGPDGTTTYEYDQFNQLTALTDPAGGRFTIGRDRLARFTSLTRPNGVTDALGYDLDSHLTSRTSTLGASTLASTAYAYDAAGQRTSVTDASGTSRYTHDASGNLASATHPVDPTETYTYDAAGNRVGSAAGSAAYDAGDHLLSDATSTYAWDAEGRLTSRTRRSDGGVTTFTWNTRDQLTAVRLPSGSVETFRYDPLGRRVEASTGGTVTRFAYDGTSVAAEYDGSNALMATYQQLPGLDQPLEMARGGQRYYYLLDGQGSVVGLTDAAGGLVATYRYDSFGRPTASTGTVSNPFTYIGREYDAGSGLYFNRARWYDPAAGRFLSEDPNWKVNPYVYAGNSPVDFEDRAGTEIEEYATLIVSQYKRALGIARLDRCLWLCVLTGLDNFQGLPADDVNRFLAKAFTDFANSQIGYEILPEPELKGPEVAEALADHVVQAMQLIEAMSGDGEMTVTEISTITVTRTTTLYSYSPPFISLTTTSYSQTTVTTRQVPNPSGVPWLTFAELGLAAYRTYETFNGEC